jgi:hypothetical protein
MKEYRQSAKQLMSPERACASGDATFGYARARWGTSPHRGPGGSEPCAKRRGIGSDRGRGLMTRAACGSRLILWFFQLFEKVIYLFIKLIRAFTSNSLAYQFEFF